MRVPVWVRAAVLRLTKWTMNQNTWMEESIPASSQKGSCVTQSYWKRWLKLSHKVFFHVYYRYMWVIVFFYIVHSRWADVKFYSFFCRWSGYQGDASPPASAHQEPQQRDSGPPEDPAHGALGARGPLHPVLLHALPTDGMGEPQCGTLQSHLTNWEVSTFRL